jgi:hypothetical protein
MSPIRKKVDNEAAEVETQKVAKDAETEAPEDQEPGTDQKQEHDPLPYLDPDKVKEKIASSGKTESEIAAEKGV